MLLMINVFQIDNVYLYRLKANCIYKLLMSYKIIVSGIIVYGAYIP